MFHKETENEKRVHSFQQALKSTELERYFDTLKGGTKAIQIQHMLYLKEKTAEGPQALESALQHAGIDSPDDRRKLIDLLTKMLKENQGLASKPVPPTEHNLDTEQWRSQIDTSKYTNDSVIDEPPEQVSGHVEEEKWPSGMKIVNGHLACSIREQGMIQKPNEFGYIHLAAEVEHPHILGGTSKRKQALLTALKQAAQQLKGSDPERIQRVDVFQATVIPPGSKEGRRVLAKGNYDIHIAEFDIVVLVECRNPESAHEVRQGKAFAKLKGLLDNEATFVHCVVAKNAKRIAEVDKERDGVFLFNYFFAADIAAKGAAGVDILLGVWEYTAGWWTAKANLTNSTPLQPVEGERSAYSLINHCRWDSMVDVVPHLIFRPSLDEFVLKNFTANDIMAMPVLYRLALQINQYS
jgi:hypothetical protein